MKPPQASGSIFAGAEFIRHNLQFSSNSAVWVPAQSFTRFSARGGNSPSITSLTLDRNRRLEFSVPRVEVRRTVIVVKHSNQNPIERADRRHPAV